ncbi:MAG: hypothetical protein WBA93_08760 [Microcoleaceae cyanobacterium]
MNVEWDGVLGTEHYKLRGDKRKKWSERVHSSGFLDGYPIDQEKKKFSF